ncbi:MAG: hypothetical protein K1X71_15065 [Pirellulales bacterium]|nr:hypothetical protein [Pirellulales bacterium]
MSDKENVYSAIPCDTSGRRSALGARVILGVLGSISVLLAVLPWVTDGRPFSIPYWNIELPNLPILPLDSRLYRFAEFPMHIAGKWVDFVFIPQEGVARVRPFFVFVFWGLSGIALLMLSTSIGRPSRVPRI